MKIGDQVRFLSEIGGGRVAGFQGKNIVLVEDEDGFQMPMLKTEVVVVGEEDYDTKHVVEAKAQSAKAAMKGSDEEELENEPADKPITFKAKPEERAGGDKLSAYLAFVPMDMKELSQTRFESYLINDSNYYLRYVYLIAEGAAWSVRAEGEIEPNTKEYIEEFGREDLNTLEHCCIQLIAYKRDKHFLLKPTVNAQVRIDTVKFYKLHAFRENMFFEQPALIYTIIENDVQKVKL
ncbi:MAG: DUF2027 domain-containing protein [Prevotella sp.]|nr:DUF2027 domain-containing protein [Prevotella sp. khp7]MCR5469769.1 DUF2027 domain-containing protein [Prevotella sp.]SEV83787.1 protein of unknown function [Prevotella sp. khp7]